MPIGYENIETDYEHNHSLYIYCVDKNSKKTSLHVAVGRLTRRTTDQ